MLKAITFERELRSGSSLPLLIVASDSSRYVVKPIGCGDGPLGSITEWITLSLARSLGLQVLEPVLVELQRGFEEQARDPEIRELIQRSIGANLATRYINDARPADAAALEQLDPATRADLFLLDVCLLNIDRTERNSNVLWSTSGLRSMDYASSMALRGAVSGQRFDERPLLSELRRSPFYSASIDPRPFAAKLMRRARDCEDDLTFGVPADWLRAAGIGAAGNDSRVELHERVRELLLNADTVVRRYEQLRVMSSEPEALRQQRAQANKAKFLERFGPI